MKRIHLFFLLLLFITASASQNVRIGTTAPAEKLDVNGNMNTTGSIKTNGADGTANQVLMKNNSGNMVWGDLCEFKSLNHTPVQQLASKGPSLPASAVNEWNYGAAGTFDEDSADQTFAPDYIDLPAGTLTLSFLIQKRFPLLLPNPWYEGRISLEAAYTITAQ